MSIRSRNEYVAQVAEQVLKDSQPTIKDSKDGIGKPFPKKDYAYPKADIKDKRLR